MKIIREHLNKHNFMNHSQLGLTKGKSRLTNFFIFYSKVYEATDNDENYDILSLYVSKSFDKVDHQRFLR